MYSGAVGGAKPDRVREGEGRIGKPLTHPTQRLVYITYGIAGMDALFSIPLLLNVWPVEIDLFIMFLDHF